MASYIKTTWPFNESAPTRRERRGCEYDAYLPDKLAGWTPRVDAGTVADLADAERGVTDLDAESNATPSMEGIARFLLRAESVGSSKIEGLQISAKRLARYEAEIADHNSSSDYVAAEILASVAQMDTAVQLGARTGRLSVADIRAMHQVLMAGSPTAELGGVLRTTQNWIGGNSYNPCEAAYVPPPPDQVEPLLEDLVEYLNGDDHPALMQAAIVHAQFETIHPFTDGNGRTGRALIHVVLRRRRLISNFVPPISLILSTEAAAYIGALEAFRHIGAADGAERSSALTNILGIFASATIRACTASTGYSVRIAELQDEWITAAGRLRSDSAAIALIRLLPGTPIVTAETAAAMTSRSRPAAANAIDRLVEAGVLQQRNLGKQRYRVYEASAALELYDSLE